MLNNSKFSIATIILLIALWLISAQLFYQPAPKKPQPQPELSVPDFKAITPVKARKAAFFEYLLPLIQAQNSRLLSERQQLISLSHKPINRLTGKEISTLKGFAEHYKLATDNEAWPSPSDFEQLLNRADIVPPSLALAQAASESGWGRSRFARQGHNYFGEWCYSAGCGFVPKSRPAGATHEVRRFDSPADSVAAYFYNLNTGDSYQDLRAIREQLRRQGEPITGVKLTPGLLNYSERREDYIADIQLIIRSNKLSRFDKTGGDRSNK